MNKIKRIFKVCIMFSLLAVVLNKSVVKADGIFSVKYNLTGVTVSPEESTADEGTAMSMEFTAKEGYKLPKSIKVTMAGATLTDGYTYEDGILNIDEVYGDMVITANGIEDKKFYKVSFDLYKSEASKSADKIEEGSAYSVKLTPKSGYSLSEANISVVVNGITQVDGYSFEDDTLIIDEITGKTVIEAMAVKKKIKENSEVQEDSSDDISQAEDNARQAELENNKSENTNNKDNTNSSNNNSVDDKKQNVSITQTEKPLKATNTYSSGNKYVAPKTGEAFDIRYLGGAALILIGAGILIIKRKNIF